MEWLNKNSDALMVIITFVYVIATIFIWRANNKSAKASKEQLEESKRQFEESQKQAKAELEESKRQFEKSMSFSADIERCKIMPYLMLSVEEEAEKDNEYKRFNLSFKNNGDGSAKDFIYSYEEEECNLVLYSGFDYKAVVSGPMSTRYIRKEKSTQFSICIITDKESNLCLKIPFKVHYKDVLDNEYEQSFEFYYGLESIGRVDTYSPKLVEKKEHENV